MANDLVDKLAVRFLSKFARERLRDFRSELTAMSVHRRGVRAAQGRKWESNVKLNIGCGPVETPGFVRVDFCPGVDVRVDLRRPLPIPDNVASMILCEHFLEHLGYPKQASDFLRECVRVLHPGGKLYLSVPDTRWPLESYVSGSTEYKKACDDHGWHPPYAETMMEHINYHFRQQDDSRSDGNFECHRYAYDDVTMEKALRAAGFTKVEQRSFDPELDAPHRRVGSLFMLAVK